MKLHSNNWRRVSRRKEEFTAQNAPTVADYEYTYSKGLHLIGKQENEENRRTAYQYDSYYRLRRVDYDCDYSSSDPTCANNRNNVFKCNTAESGCEDFQLDGVHNIRSSYENQTNFAWTVDGFNRLTQKSDGSNTVKYSYDPFNRRTEKTVYYTENSDTYEQTHKYVYNDWDIISEEIKTLRTSDNPVTTTAWELRRYVDQGTDNHIIMDTVSCSDDGNGNCSPNESTLQRIWFHKDERGNIIAISDGNGTIYERYRYRVYGEHEVLNADFTPKTTAAISPFLWGGSLYEPETNLYWMRNRYYHIDMHRFINQDPIGIWGDANNLGNGFAYVAGMVIEASDPSGLDTEFIYWLPTVSFTGTFGHISIRIDDTSYSWELVEMSIKNFEEYRKENVGYRLGFAVVLNISKEKENILRANLEKLPQHVWSTQGGYRLFKNNCGQVALREVSKATGYQFKKDITLPKAVIREVFDSPLNRGEKWYTKQSPSSVEPPKDEKKNTESSKKEDSESPKEKTDPESKTGVSEDDDYFGSNITKTKYNEANVDCGYGSCECVSGDCSRATGENMPSDPDKDPSNAIQKILMSNILAKMLKRGESEQPPVFVDTGTGPNGAIKIYRNPYYINKDPLKNILILGYDGSKPIFVRNPLALPTSRTWSNTYERWQQNGFIQPEVDPWEEKQ